MFYTISVKPIILNTSPVSHACTKCSQENQTLTVYKKYLHLSWLLMIPLRKSCRIDCHQCGHSLSKRQFIRQLRELGGDARRMEDQVYTKISQAKTPLHPKIRLGIFALLAITLCAFVNYNDKKSEAIVNEYKAHPVKNVLLIVKHKKEKFPFEIIFVKAIRDQKVKILRSKYVYKSLHNATQELDKIKNAIANRKYFEDFNKSTVIKLEELLSYSIAWAYPLPQDTSVVAR